MAGGDPAGRGAAPAGREPQGAGPAQRAPAQARRECQETRRRDCAVAGAAGGRQERGGSAAGALGGPGQAPDGDPPPGGGLPAGCQRAGEAERGHADDEGDRVAPPQGGGQVADLLEAAGAESGGESAAAGRARGRIDRAEPAALRPLPGAARGQCRAGPEGQSPRTRKRAGRPDRARPAREARSCPGRDSGPAGGAAAAASHRRAQGRHHSTPEPPAVPGPRLSPAGIPRSRPGLGRGGPAGTHSGRGSGHLPGAGRRVVFVFGVVAVVLRAQGRGGAAPAALHGAHPGQESGKRAAHPGHSPGPQLRHLD
mmetsp:Transcript_30525/g.43789  ORF Transcript_30525/g.43789 Transcript_30525/m.43789 type:complete len:312 (+) Transcript_30525:606-1541(+)